MSAKAKPPHGLGGGVMEIWANDASGTYRAVYTVSIADTIYVIHAFQNSCAVRGRMRKRKILEREPSTGNVFADLGLAGADEHLIKAGLVIKIGRIIRQRALTQAAAAQLMGIDQPKVSAMLTGQFRGYSVERLMRFLVALGHDVEIVVKPRERGTAELRVA
jgi:predicted XRE-type DNA-binding protein